MATEWIYDHDDIEFLKACCYKYNKMSNTPVILDDTDIKNTKSNLIKNSDWTDGDEERRAKINHLVYVVIGCSGPSFQAKIISHKIDKDGFESSRLFIGMHIYERNIDALI